ncbi:hypothetical protein DR864_27245 [Runella rosea]|uniref:Uncharacterized protein n=1 Tax=Runella rosea TaxID=2259595 RepID=A0A344TR98_9BACT|nr:hypothetical protein [Runella rosea]AXE21169.1 hypothetical protein DR864_27245 [Runella rosea]
MVDEILKDSFLGMLQIMQADMIKLSDVAETSAREEAMKIVNSGRGYHTTSSIGHNLSYAGTVHSKLTAPLAMTCFAIMDVIGKILDNCIIKLDDNDSASSGSFINHAREFEKFINRDYLKNPKTAEKFQDAFRHSMAHCFLPGSTKRVAYEITYHYEFANEPLIFDRGTEYVLNVKCLSAMTQNVLEKLITMTKLAQKEDQVVVDKIVESFELVIKQASQKLEHLEDN